MCILSPLMRKKFCFDHINWYKNGFQNSKPIKQALNCIEIGYGKMSVIFVQDFISGSRFKKITGHLYMNPFSEYNMLNLNPTCMSKVRNVFEECKHIKTYLRSIQIYKSSWILESQMT